MDPEAFVTEFFSDFGMISKELQNDYMEAFVLRYKQKPQDNPKKFLTYIISLKDPTIKACLSQWRVRTRTGFSETPKDFPFAAKESIVQAPLSSDLLQILRFNEWPPNFIFSLSCGVEEALKRKETTVLSEGGKTLQFEKFSFDAEKRIHQSSVSIHIESYQDLESLSHYVFYPPSPDTLSPCLVSRCRHVVNFMMSETLSDADAIEIVKLHDTTDVNQKNVVYGRILADNEGGLNEYSALIEILAPDQSVVKTPFQLLLNQLNQYQVFSGQVAAVQVADLHKEKLYPFSLSSGIQSISLQNNDLQALCAKLSVINGKINLLVASGPFCDADGFDTKLLDAFINFVEQTLPNFVILLGPLVDINNHVVSTGDPVVRVSVKGMDPSHSFSGPFLTYDDLYRIILNRIVLSEKIKASVTVLLMPSVYDVEHPYPIPQPPLDLQRFFPNKQWNHIRLLSNPGSFIIQGALRVALTSADPISPLLTTFITKGYQGSQRLYELHATLLRQLSFFPTFPLNLPIDPMRFSKPPCTWTPDSLPHILIYRCEKIPPDFKMIQGRLFINCGKLASRSPSLVSLSINCVPENSVTELTELISVKYLKLTSQDT